MDSLWCNAAVHENVSAVSLRVNGKLIEIQLQWCIARLTQDEPRIVLCLNRWITPKIGEASEILGSVVR